MVRKATWLYFGVLCLLVPTLLYAQQTKTPATGTATAVEAAQLAAANPKTPAEFFARARQLSDLISAGIPFHLKATFVATGEAEFKGNGTIEEWWQSKDLWRKEATLGDFRYVAFSNGGDHKSYATSDYPPLRIALAMGVVLVRISKGAGSSDDWTIQQKKVRDLDLTVLSDPSCTPKRSGLKKKGHRKSSKYPAGDFCMQDFFTPHGLIRIQRRYGQSIVYNDFQPFQTLLVPRVVDVGDSHHNEILKISIDTLESLPTEQQTTQFLAGVPAEMKPSEEIGDPMQDQIGRAVKPPRVVYTALPEFPRGDWSKTTVVVETKIDQQGRPRELRVIQSAGKSFDDAALSAVGQYRFKPATVDGKPVVMKIDIIVDFHKW